MRSDRVSRALVLGAWVCGPLLLSAQASPAQTTDELIALAVRPLPADLQGEATVLRYDPDSGEREVLREGANPVECEPPGPEGFTRCWPRSAGAFQDFQRRLYAQGRSAEDVHSAVEEAVAAGSLEPPRTGSLAYRLSEEDDRIQLLWMVLVPNATAAELAAPTGSQRDASLAGRGTPWMMREGTLGAHLMIPVNGTDRSNPGEPGALLDASTVTDPVAQATLPLPEDLRPVATVSRFDPGTGRREVLRQGSSTIECRPRNPETGYTRCYHESVWAARDLRARLEAEGRSDEEIQGAMASARAEGRIQPTTVGSLAYRLWEDDDRIRLLWMVRVPGATAAELGMPTAGQRDAALAGRGTPWMMLEGTPGAHLMIPINGTELSNR